MRVCVNMVVKSTCFVFLALIMQASLRTAEVSPRSSPLRDVSRRGTPATQRQKFNTDDSKSVRNPGQKR